MKNMLKWMAVTWVLLFLMQPAGCPSPTPNVTPTPVPLDVRQVLDLVKIPGDLYEYVPIYAPEGWQVTPLDSVPGTKIKHPDGKMGMYFELRYDCEVTTESALADLRADLEAGQPYSMTLDVSSIDPTTAVVYDENWPAYGWVGVYAYGDLPYSGVVVAVPYGENVMTAFSYAPTDQWAYYSPTFDAILASLAKPADDYDYVLDLSGGPGPGGIDPLAGWTSYVTGRFGVSIKYPGAWTGPEDPWEGDGLWWNTPEGGFVLWIRDYGDPEQLLEGWDANTLAGADLFTVTVSVPGAPVTILDEEWPTLAIEGTGPSGEDVTAQTAFVPRTDDSMQVLWYANAGAWDGAQESVEDVVASIRAWTNHHDQQYGFSTLYPYDWPAPTTSVDGSGVWFILPGCQAGMGVWVYDGGDPETMLGEWDGTDVFAVAVSGERPKAPLDCQDAFDSDDVAVDLSDALFLLGEQWPTKTVTSQGGPGVDLTGQVVFAARDGRVVEVFWYAPTGEGWDEAQATFDSMLSMLWLH